MRSEAKSSFFKIKLGCGMKKEWLRNSKIKIQFFIYTLKITIDWVILDFYGKVPLFYKILIASQYQ